MKNLSNTRSTLPSPLTVPKFVLTTSLLGALGAGLASLTPETGTDPEPLTVEASQASDLPPTTVAPSAAQNATLETRTAPLDALRTEAAQPAQTQTSGETNTEPVEPAELRTITTLKADADASLPCIVLGVVPVPASERTSAELAWVTHEGFAVQREVLSRDAAGNPDSYLVHAPLVRSAQRGTTCVDVRESRRQGLTSYGDMDYLRELLEEGLTLSLQVSGGAAYRTPNLLCAPQTRGPWTRSADSWNRFLSRSGALLGVHSYVDYRADGIVEVALRLNNGVALPDGSGVNGAVFFDDLRVDVPAGFVLVPEIQRAGEELALDASRSGYEYRLVSEPSVMPVRTQVLRRFALCRPGQERAARRVLDLECWTRAEGQFSFFRGGWGTRYEPLPDFSREPLASSYWAYSVSGPRVFGWEAVERRAEQARESLESAMVQGGTGLFNPLGLTHAYEHGGRWIHTADPYLSRAWMRYWRLAQLRNVERMPVACYHAQTGAPISPAEIAAANGGELAWEIHHTNRSQHQISWWNDARPVGDASPSQTIQLGEIEQWHYHDAEHAIRAFLPERNLAFGMGDRVSIDSVRLSVAHYSLEWTLEQIADARSPKWRDKSLKKMLADAQANPHQGYAGGRNAAWVGELMLLAYRLRPQARAAELEAWLSAFAQWMQLCATRFDLLQRRSFPTYMSPNPHTNGVPQDNDAAQVLELGLIGITAAGLARNEFQPDAMSCLVRHGWNSVNRASNNAFPPKKWIAYRPDGSAYAPDYGSESFQSHHWRYLAGFRGDEAYVREVVNLTLTDNERLVHAAACVAEVVNVD